MSAPAPSLTGTTPGGTAYRTFGDPARPTILMIHGLGLAQQLFDHMVEALSAQHQLVTYDLYGHGKSAPPPNTADLFLYAQQIEELIAHLDVGPVHLVGFSIGGMINRKFAMQSPSKLRSLVIWNSPHDRGEKGQQEVEARAKTVRDQGTMSTLPGAIKRWFTPGFIERQPDTVDLVRQWRELVDAEGYAQAAWVLANGVRELIAPPTPIRVPTFVLTCQNDSGSTPQHAYQIMAEIDDAEIAIIDDLQHLGLMEAPQAFVDITLDFINRVQES